MSRPLLTWEELEAHPRGGISCPHEFCDDWLDADGVCVTCEDQGDPEWYYCPVCLMSFTSDRAADKCYEECRPLLDRIVDALN